MWLNHIILAFLWILYCVLHSVLADTGIKKRLSQAMGKNYRYYRLFYNIFAFLFLVALIYFQVSISTAQLFEVSTPILIAGFIIAFSGMVLMVICIGKYFFNISGLRSLVHEEVANVLVISGIHKYVRHPLYLGTFAFIWGLFLLLPYFSLLISDTIITVYTLIGIGLEEKKLISEFGDSYSQYRSQVPKLIPMLKLKRKS